MLPGPVQTSRYSLNSMTNPMINHKSLKFIDIYSNSQKMCAKIFNSDPDNVAIIGGSGTLGMESAIRCLANKNDTILNISNGKFGERFNDISRIYGNTIKLSYNWGDSININDVKEIIDENTIDIITVVHNETSTGILNPIQEIGKLTKKNGILFVVDAISSFGGEKIDFSKYNIDIGITASQKSLSSVPGLTIISTSENAINKMKCNNNRPYYNDILKYIDKKVPFTPPISLFYSLECSLNSIINYGIEKFINKHKIFSESIRCGIKNMNLELFSKINKYSQYSNTLNVIKSPEKIPSSLIIKEMNNRGIIIANGHDKIHEKVFRIGNMGSINFSDIVVAITQLEYIMYKHNIIKKFGVGTKSTLDYIDCYYNIY